MAVDPKENLLRAIHHDNPWYVPRRDEELFKRVIYEGALMPLGAGGIDAWGVSWEGTRSDMVCFPKGNPIASPEDIDHYEFPDPSAFRLSEASVELLRTIDRRKCLVFGSQPYFLFERVWALMGMENALVSIVTDPARITYLVHRIADYNIGIAGHYIRLGVDGFRATEDLGSQRALMIPPAVWREIFKPEMKRIIDFYKAHGKLAYIHSCGCVTEIMQDLVEIGVDIIDPLQAHANDLPTLKDRFGDRITFLGAVDAHTVATATPEEVKDEVKLRIRQLARGGGYVVGPDQMLPFPAENLEALRDAAVQYGQYPIRT